MGDVVALSLSESLGVPCVRDSDDSSLNVGELVILAVPLDLEELRESAADVELRFRDIDADDS